MVVVVVVVVARRYHVPGTRIYTYTKVGRAVVVGVLALRLRFNVNTRSLSIKYW